MTLHLGARTWLVGSGDAGFSLSHRLDCHVYAIDGSEAWILIDAGAGVDQEGIVANILQSGIDTSKPGWLVLTHAHSDHSAGAAGLQAAFPALRVAAGRSAARWIEVGSEFGTGLGVARRAGLYPLDYTHPGCPEVEPLNDGHVFELGGARITALHTPGHSRGHFCYLLESDAGKRSLFSGDCIFVGGRVSVQALHDANLTAYAASIRKLATIGTDALFPGHYEISLARGQRHLDSAATAFAAGQLPTLA